MTTKTNSLRNEMVYLDFEYNDKFVVCCAVYHNKEKYFFDFRMDKDTELFKQFVKTMEGKVFAAYSLNAEIGAMLRLGVDVTKLKCVDLLVEGRMVTMSHPQYFAPDSTLLTALRVLLKKKDPNAKAEKDKMRDLILDNSFWEDEEWDAIKTYCESDVDDLEELFEKIIEILRKAKFPYKLSHATKRGSVIRKSVEMDFASEGFPVGPEFEVLYKYKDKMRDEVVAALPHYWRACYAKKKDGKWSLSRKLVKEVVLKAEWRDWKTTANGGLKLDKDYLKTLRATIPEVEPLRQCLKSLQALNGKDLREIEHDGYVDTGSFLFCAVTGRNGLYPTRGYMFNLPPWIRRTVCPKEGKVLIGSDWSQQEVAVAAKLSGDVSLIEAYNSGDVYLALGKQSGIIPEDGTKYTHQTERDMMKILQLGLTYGKQLHSLTKDIQGLLQGKMTKVEAGMEAAVIFNWHKQHFSTYWKWISQQIVEARAKGWIATNDNWMRFVDRRVKETQLLNFPSQSHGAVMMRIAVEMFYELWQRGLCPPILCTQHDAVYFNADADPKEVERLGELITLVMTQASVEAVDIETRSEISVYNHEDGYKPEKWNETNETLWVMLQKLGGRSDEEDMFFG